MRTRLRGHAKVPEAAINVTSLLDVVFVLLITFMVVAPALRHNVDLQLPKVGDTGGEVNAKKRPVSVQVKYVSGDSAEYYVNGAPVLLSQLPAAVKAAKGYDGDPVVALEADKRVPWQDVSALINELKINSITNIGIVTEKASGG